MFEFDLIPMAIGMRTPLDPDLYVGYLYKFVVEFPIILHSIIYFKRWSKSKSHKNCTSN